MKTRFALLALSTLAALSTAHGLESHPRIKNERDIHDLADKIKDAVHTVGEKAQEVSEDVAQKVKETAPKVEAAVEKTVDDIAHKVQHMIDCPMVCTMDYRPVCASDGNTYSNKCMMKSNACRKQEKLTVVYEGECKDSEITIEEKEGSNDVVDMECMHFCAQDYKPVCGSNGVTYPNECELGNANCAPNIGTKVTVQSEGVCETLPLLNLGPAIPYNEDPETNSQPEIDSKESCRRPCPRVLRPVCASNGVTYPNKCVMEVSGCETNDELTIVSMGACSTASGGDSVDAKIGAGAEETLPKDPCLKPCNRILMPVCASNGKTYSNVCEMEVGACQTNEELSVAFAGYCCELSFCTADYAPVCASDGNTYSNECQFKSARCGDNSFMELVHEGECGPESTLTGAGASAAVNSAPETSAGESGGLSDLVLICIVVGIIITVVVVCGAVVAITAICKQKTQSSPLDYNKLFEDSESEGPPAYDFQQSEILAAAPPSMKFNGNTYEPVPDTDKTEDTKQ